MRILVADDHSLYRKGLCLLLRDLLKPEEIVEADGLDGALTALQSSTFGLVVLDLNMPGMDGVSSIASVKSKAPDARVIVLSASDDKDNVLGALAQGAHGYVWKGEDDEEIERAFGAIRDGSVYVPSFLVGDTSQTPLPEKEAETTDTPELAKLTDRQRDVYALLADGKSNKEIARDLDISPSTVKVHLAAIFRAIGAQNRTQAVAMAKKRGGV